MIWLIKQYRRWIAPWLPAECRFEETCSRYAERMIREHGVWKGFILAARRIGSCR